MVKGKKERSTKGLGFIRYNKPDPVKIRMRRGGNKRGESKLASNHFFMCGPQSGPLRDVHGVTQRRKEGGRRQRWPGGEKWESKGGGQIQPVISSLCVLHSQEHTKRFTELGREEKGEEGDRGDLVEK